MVDQPNTVPGALRASAARHPDRDAVVDGAVRLTYRELDRAVLEATGGLLALGVAPGDRVAVWAQNCWQWCVACLSVMAAGAVVVPVNTRFLGDEAAYLLDNSGAVALFTTTGFLDTDYPAMLRAAAPRMAGLPVVVMDGEVSGTDLSWAQFLARGAVVPEEQVLRRIASVRSDDVSDIMYTSGTTGFPKGVVQTHAKNLLAMGSFAAGLGLRPEDRNLVLAPMFAQFGLRCGLLIDVLVGATSVLDSVFDGNRVLELIERERVSVLPGPPTILAALLTPGASSRDLSALRIAIMGSTVIPEQLVVELLEHQVFDTVFTAYGLTEACGPVSLSAPTDPPERVSTYAGRVMDHLELRVVGPDGTRLDRGERGELLVRSPAVMNGYLGDPDRTAQALDADGWLHTGDVGLLTEDGYLRITGRLKDMIIVGGLNVYPAEVENRIREHAGVADVALIGIADERLGEVGLAYVVPAPGARTDPAELHRWCRDSMANYKVPRVFVEIGSLPLNSSMKVDKPALRRRARALGHRTVAVSSS